MALYRTHRVLARAFIAAALVVMTGRVALWSQSMAVAGLVPVSFEVISIKPNRGTESGGGMRTQPDGTFTMINQPIRSILLSGSPVPVREAEGAPAWVNTERYDIIAKPPAGATRQQRGEMMRNLLIERLQLRGHVEERERDIYALELARADRRLGPLLKPSTLDCRAPTASSAAPPSAEGAASRCGMLMGADQIVSGGLSMDLLVGSLGGLVGRPVFNRTGLEGFYGLTLRFSRPETGPGPTNPDGDDQPEIFTALREQLGLKLQPDKSRLPVFVVDYIERPSEN